MSPVVSTHQSVNRLSKSSLGPSSPLPSSIHVIFSVAGLAAGNVSPSRVMLAGLTRWRCHLRPCPQDPYRPARHTGKRIARHCSQGGQPFDRWEPLELSATASNAAQDRLADRPEGSGPSKASILTPAMPVTSGIGVHRYHDPIEIKGTCRDIKLESSPP